MVEINWYVFGLQAVTFLIAMPLVYKLFISKLAKTLKDRDAFIRDGIEKVESGKAEITEIKDDYEKKISEIEDMSRNAIATANAEGEKAKQKMMDQAKTEGSKMIAEAKVEINKEKVKAIEDVKDAIVEITMSATEKIIKKKITKKDQMGIIAKHIKDIEKRVN